MEVRQLQILRELGELGSVKAVADALLVTPSAVSQQLALLTRSAGVPLTRKEGRNLVLTDVGKVLAEAGGAVVRAIADARAVIDSYHEDPAGIVSVSAFHSAGQALFGRLAARLAAEAHDDGAPPRLRLADEDVSQHGFPALTAHYDLVLAHRMAHTEQWPKDRLLVMPLVWEPFDVVLPIGHPLAELDSLTAADVADVIWVSSRAGYSPADVLGAIGAIASRAPEVAHRINDYSTVATLVAAGDVLGLLPRYTVTGGLSGVTTRPLEGIAAGRSIDLLLRPENARRRSVRKVAETLRDLVQELVAEANERTGGFMAATAGSGNAP